MRAGRHDVAHAIALKYLQGLQRTYAKAEPHTLWECNSAEDDAPGITGIETRKTVKPDFVGWSGIGPTAMLIENVIGIDIDMLEYIERAREMFRSDVPGAEPMDMVLPASVIGDRHVIAMVVLVRTAFFIGAGETRS